MASHFCPDIVHIRPLEDFSVLVVFDDGKTKICNLSDHLERGIFKALKDKKIFNLVHVEHGAAVWNEHIDIAPEYLYEHGTTLT